jgi:hypothetical protein
VLNDIPATAEQASQFRRQVLEFSHTGEGQVYYADHTLGERRLPPRPLEEMQAVWEQDRMWVSPEFFSVFGGMHKLNVFLLSRTITLDGKVHAGIFLITNGGTLVKTDNDNMCCVYFQSKLPSYVGHFEVVQDAEGRRRWGADDPVLTDCLWPAMCRMGTARSVRDSRQKMLVAAANRINRANETFQVGGYAWLKVPDKIVEEVRNRLRRKRDKEATNVAKLLVKVLEIYNHPADGELAPLPTQMFKVAVENGTLLGSYPIDMLSRCDPPPEPSVYRVVGLDVSTFAASKQKPIRLVRAYTRYIQLVNDRRDIAARLPPSTSAPSLIYTETLSSSSPAVGITNPPPTPSPAVWVDLEDEEGVDDLPLPCTHCKEKVSWNRYTYCMYGPCNNPFHKPGEGCFHADRVVVVDKHLLYCRQSCASLDRGVFSSASVPLPSSSSSVPLSQPDPSLPAQRSDKEPDLALSQPVHSSASASTTKLPATCVSCLLPIKGRGAGCCLCVRWHHHIPRGQRGCTRAGWTKEGSISVDSIITCVGCRYKDDKDWKAFLLQVLEQEQSLTQKQEKADS